MSPNSAAPRLAVLDVGSNSVRLVVYHGLSRSPAILFNEKVLAGLGRGLRPGGRLAAEAMDVAVAAIARFALLADAMAVGRVRAVATAAVRNAENGADFVRRVAAETGIEVEIIDGGVEARVSAAGVLAGIPDADGIVGDLGGGSLELVRVAGGRSHEQLSLPLGALRLGASHRQGREVLQREIDRALSALEPRFGAMAGRGLPFYAVGGSWRALTHLHMHLARWPLPVIHQYQMPADAAERLVRTLAHLPAKALKRVPALTSARIPELPAAAALLRAVVKKLGSSAVIASAFGLREGLLFEALPLAVRGDDPLLAGARDLARQMGRFADGSELAIGDALLAFSDGLFADEGPELRRLRHATALLADSSWRAHPDMRAEDAAERALHTNWGGIDASGRAMLANALWTVNGGDCPGTFDAILGRLASDGELERARRWGLALRLGQRLGGGVARPLGAAGLRVDGAALVLSLPRVQAALYGPSVARRHRLLAEALRLQPELRLADPLRATAS